MRIDGQRLRQSLAALRHCVGEHGEAPWLCPVCGQAALYRSHAVTWTERVGRSARMRKYRCHACRDRRWRLRVASAAEPARNDPAAVAVPRSRRLSARALVVLGTMAASLARAVRAVMRTPVQWCRQIPIRGLVVIALLATTVGGIAWAFVAHRHSLRQRGEQAVSLGHTWWDGARGRLSLMVTDLKLRATPAPPAEAAPTTAAAKSAPSKRATVPAKRTAASPKRPSQSVATATASATAATPRVQNGAGAVAWRTARWGMTVDEVLEAFPAEALRVNASATGPSQPMSTRAAIERASIGAHRGSVSFLFGADGRLASIRVRPEVRPESTRQAYRELAEWLAGELQTPPRREARAGGSGTRTEVSSWTTADNRVDLIIAETAVQDARVLALDMHTGDVQAMPRGVELWYQPVPP